MKISTKTILPTTLSTLSQRMLRLATGQLKMLVMGALLLLALTATNRAFATRSGALSAGTLPTSTTICKGAAQQVIYSFRFTESGSSNTLNTFKFTTSGTATTTDIPSYTLYINNSNSLTGATAYGPVTNAGMGLQTITGIGKNLNATSFYFFIVANVSATATTGNTVTVAQITNTTATTNFTFATTGETYSGSAGAGTAQSIAASPIISSAASAFCPGTTTTINATPTGGVWASSNTAIATVNTSGVVTGVAAAGGTATITYTQGGCPATVTETVNVGPNVPTVSPASSYTICAGSNVTVTGAATAPTPTTLLSQNFNATPSGLVGQVGGTWTIDNTGTSPFFGSGGGLQMNVYPSGTAVDFGFTTISGDGTPYALVASNFDDNLVVTRLISPSFSTTGFTSATLSYNEFAESQAYYLSFFGFGDGDHNFEIDYSTDGGTTWSLFSNQINDFDEPGGSSVGTFTAATPQRTISFPAGALNQPSVKLRYYYNSIDAEWWAIDNVVVQASPTTIPATSFTWAGPGSVSCPTGCYASVLTPTVGGLNTYTVTAAYAGCTRSTAVPVNVVVPQTILSNTPLCLGSSTTTLTNAITGGTWASSNVGVATIGSTSGTLTGTGTGVATVTYTVPPGCTSTAQVTVNPLPNVSTFSTPSATNPCAGNGAVVSVAASTLGTATYTVQYTLSSANTGTGSATLTTVAGIGTFTTIALANPGSTTVTITSISNSIGCSSNVTSGSTVTFNVNTGTTAITGTATVCAGQTTALGDATTGGTWSSSNTAVATTDNTGLVTGVAGGTATISYVAGAGCAATQVVTVNTAPPITGLRGLCVAQTTTLADAITGGTWTSSNAGVATINSTTGAVTSVAIGTTTISYAVPGGCTATTVLGVTNTPSTFTVTGGGTYCAGGAGVHVGLTGSNAGVSYQPYIGSTAIGSPVTGTGGVIDFGLETATGTYTVTGNPGTACAVTMTGTAIVTTNPAPAVYTVGGGGTFCAGSIGANVTLSGSDFGFTYQLYNGSVPVGTARAGVSGPLNFGLQTAPGVYTVTAINGSTGCSIAMNGSATITANAVPGNYIVTGGGGFCAGGTGVPVGLSNSDAGVTYTLSRGGSTVYMTTGTGAALNFGLFNVSGTYTVSAVSPAGCTANMTGSAVVVTNPLPAINNVTGGGAYCAGGTGVHIGLNGSSVGVNYQLSNGAPVGAPVTGTNFALDFGLQTAAGSYTVSALNPTTGCTNNMAGSVSVSVNPLPVTTYSVTGGGSYCTGGTGYAIGLSASDIGVSYQLLNGFTPQGAAVAGTGGAISFGTVTLGGTYSVQATITATGCTAIMTGSASIIVNNPPPVFTVVGGGSYCIGGTGVTVALSGSSTGVKYQLYNGATPVGGLVTGTGFALNFGLQTAAGSYNVVATDTVTTCTSNMTGSATVIINPLPNVFALTGGGGYCPGTPGVHVGLSGSDANVNYTLIIGSTPSAVLAGTGSPLDYGLETAATNYIVTARNTITGCADTMSGFSTITINTPPTAYNVSSTATTYCAGGLGDSVLLSNSATGVNYQLYLNGVALGTPVAGTGLPLFFGRETSAGTYTAIATTAGATGCVTNMTGSATITITPLPTVYTVGGGGSYCTGGSGVNITLNGSATGVSYQLYNAGTAAGTAVSGTGTTLSFGPVTAAGSYTILATNATTTCSVNMLSNAVVSVNPLPAVEAISGGGGYCAGTAGRAVGMATSTVGINYQLYNGATAIGGLTPGTGAAFNFGLEPAGTYSVVATNATTGCVNNMSGTAVVTVNPTPVIDTVTGGGGYCSSGTGVHVGINMTSIGVNYQLYKGTILVGSPVAGTGAAYDFGAELAAGTYTVVATNATTGCTSNMYGGAVVTINPLPTLYDVAGGGTRCPASAGLQVLLNGSDPGVSYQLMRGGVNVGTPVAGTGSFLSFGYHMTAGIYTIQATNTTTGCTRMMYGNTIIIVAPLPTVDTVTGGGNYCPGGTGVAVTLNTSSTSVTYQLYHDGFATGSPVSGTGDTISFGPQTATGNYTVIATDSGTTTCSTNMYGSVTVGYYPVPATFAVSGGGSLCPGGAGVPVIIGGSETGVTYQLFDGSIAEGSAISGTGGSLNFGAQTATGAYSVIATNNTTTCTSTMTGGTTITNYPVPAAYAVTGGGSYCIGGTGVAVSLAGSSIGTHYQLYDNGAAVGGSVAGTGSGLNFGLQSAAGNYAVVATNATGCTNNMSDTVTVSISPLPTVYTVASSATSYCAGGTGVDVYLSNSSLGVNYQLYRGGTMIGTPVMGNGSAISFGLQTVAGTYTMVAVDATTGCTSNMSSSALISINPAPTVNDVIGGGSYCVGTSGAHVGVDGSMPGVNYQLQSSGVNIGTPISGTGAALDFGAELAGTYTVVASDRLTGCTSNMNGSATVAVNALPNIYTVTGGGSYCDGSDGVTVSLSGSDITGVSYQLMRGGAAIGAPVAATGGALNFGRQTLAGTYTVMATGTTTSCSITMPSSVNVSVNTLPTVYTLTGGGSYCAGGTGVTVGLSGSATGIRYQLYRAGTMTGSPVAGTGSAISFGTPTTAGAYTVVATNTATGCTSNMAGSANVIINALPTVYNVTGGGNYCPGTEGAHIGLDGSASGVLYQVYTAGGSAAGGAISGTGSPLDLGAHPAGTYTVSATNAATGCTSNMAGTATSILGTAVTPSVTVATGVGDTVCSGTSTTFSAITANGGSSPTYQWSVNGVVASFGSSYTYTPTNGDNVSVTLTSNAACATPTTANGSLVISVLPSALPAVAVTLSTGTEICQGTTVTYTANPTYGGTSPIYTWLKNGVSVAAGNTYSYSPGDSDIIAVRLTSDYVCRLANIVSSNNVLMIVDTPVMPVVTIDASPSAHVNIGDLVTLTATVAHAGSAPTYQWYVNGVPVTDAVTPILTSSNFVNGDSVTLQVTSSGACAGLIGFNSVRIYTNLGVQQVNGNNANVALIPNPNNGQFTLKGTLGIVTDEEVALEVYDMLGQVIYKKTVMTHNGNINEQIQLNGNLANGMYILNLHSASQSNIFHFVIEQ